MNERVCSEERGIRNEQGEEQKVGKDDKEEVSRERDSVGRKIVAVSNEGEITMIEVMGEENGRKNIFGVIEERKRFFINRVMMRLLELDHACKAVAHKTRDKI